MNGLELEEVWFNWTVHSCIKKTLMSSLSIKAQHPPLLSKPSSFPAALIWSSFLHLGLSSLFIHASTKHVVSPDMREKGELD